MSAAGRLHGGLVLVALVVAAMPAAAVPGARARPVARVGAAPANGWSSSPAISADGRHVAFYSFASNLVAGDSHVGDVFVRDRLRGTTELVSVSSAGERGKRNSGYSGGVAVDEPVAVSADGRFVAFVSDAWNLVAGDTNGQKSMDGESCPDVFVRDRVAGTTERVNVSSSGRQAKTHGFMSCSGQPAISADGRFVAFQSDASNLVAGDTNRVGDVFVRDRAAGTTIRVSVSSAGRQGNGASSRPRISADGRLIFFVSGASNLVAGQTKRRAGIFAHDRLTGRTTRLTSGDDLAISVDGRIVAYSTVSGSSGTANAEGNVFLRDRATGKTTRVSVSSSGTHANGFSGAPLAISANGRFIAFASLASNLAPGHAYLCPDYRGDGSLRGRFPCSDMFVYDRGTARTERVSPTGGGQQANARSEEAAISADGRFVAFTSTASNLVAGDSNRMSDVFVRDRRTGATSLISVGK